MITQEQIDFGPCGPDGNKFQREAFQTMCRLINETDTQFEWQVVKKTIKWKWDAKQKKGFISDNPEDWYDVQEICHIPTHGEFSASFDFCHGGCIYVWVNGKKRMFKNPDEEMRKSIKQLDYTKDPQLALERAEKSIANSNKIRQANERRRMTLEEKKLEKTYAEIQSRLNMGKRAE